MIATRRAGERGETRLDWLSSRHSFSFGGFRDPAWMGFRSLRVINEDRVAPASGFGHHPHRSMEILTVMRAGALAHEDSAGHRRVIQAGTVQRMSAGSGIVHAEMNPSQDEECHFLQIWIETTAPAIAPEYEEGHFPFEAWQGRLRPLASPDRRDDSLEIHADAVLHGAALEAGTSLTHTLAPGRAAWLQALRGSVAVADAVMHAGDGVAVEDERMLELRALEDSELLLFDLA